MTAQRILRQRQASVQTALRHTSTGVKIERGIDGPAALIATNRFNNQLTRGRSAVANADRAAAVLSTVEGGLSSLSGTLLQMRSLVAASANHGGLSREEKAAQRLQLHEMLDSIDRTAEAVRWNDTPLLDGRFAKPEKPMLFAITGEADKRSAVHLDAVSTATLGRRSGTVLTELRSLPLFDADATGHEKAAVSVEAAISEVAMLRGQLGATLRHKVEAVRRSMEVQNQNLAHARSTIADTDYAGAMADLVQQRLLLQAAQQSLQTAAESPRSALSLLA